MAPQPRRQEPPPRCRAGGHPGLPLCRGRPHSPVLSGHCHQSRRRSRGPRRQAPPPRHGHRHREDVHRLSVHLAALEGQGQAPHPLPRGPQRPPRSDKDRRLQALWRRDDPDHESQGRHGLRDLPRSLPGHLPERPRQGRLPPVLPHLLRSHRRRRVPPWERRRQLGLARGPRLLLCGHADRAHRHAQGDSRRLHNQLLRRSHLHLQPQTRDRGRLSRPVQGRPRRPRQGPCRLASREGQGRQERPAHRGQGLWPTRLRPFARPHEAHRARGKKAHPLPLRDQPLGQDHRLLRGHRPRRPHAHGPPERQRRPLRPGQPLRDEDHRRRRRRQARALELLPPRGALSDARHHLQAPHDRHRRQDLQGHRARPEHPVHDRVQADHRPRHTPLGGARQDVLHHPRLPPGHRALRRSGLRRRRRPDPLPPGRRPHRPARRRRRRRRQRGFRRDPPLRHPGRHARPRGGLSGERRAGDHRVQHRSWRQTHQIRRRRRHCLHHRRARPALRPRRQARRRVPPRLLQEPPPRALPHRSVLRRSVGRGAPQTGSRRGALPARRLLHRAWQGGRTGPIPLRPRPSRRLRSPRPHPQGARGGGARHSPLRVAPGAPACGPLRPPGQGRVRRRRPREHRPPQGPTAPRPGHDSGAD